MEEMLKEILEKLNRIESSMATKEELAKVSQSQARMESELTNKVRALYDAREVQFDVNERILDSLGRIENKIDRVSLKVSSHDAILQRVK